MEKAKLFRSPLQDREAELVAGVSRKDVGMQSKLYDYCKRNFWTNYRGLFFINENDAVEIFQNSFITLWENIERGKIMACDGIVVGKNSEPLNGSILTYFMGIAKNKYKEWARSRPTLYNPETEQQMTDEEWGRLDAVDVLYDPSENTMMDIVSDVISRMSKRCNEVLSKYYYEEKSLDAILQELPNFESKNALKTMKYKCMENLRKSAQEIYHRYLNS